MNNSLLNDENILIKDKEKLIQSNGRFRIFKNKYKAKKIY